MTYQYEPVVLAAAHQALADLIDGGGDVGRIKIYDSGGVLLATFVLQNPCGTVDTDTGQLTLAPAAPELNAPAGGVAHHAELENGDGDRLLTVSVQAGTGPVPGVLVVSVANIVAGGTVELVSATFG